MWTDDSFLAFTVWTFVCTATTNAAVDMHECVTSNKEEISECVCTVNLHDKPESVVHSCPEDDFNKMGFNVLWQRVKKEEKKRLGGLQAQNQAYFQNNVVKMFNQSKNTNDLTYRSGIPPPLSCQSSPKRPTYISFSPLLTVQVIGRLLAAL